MSEQNLFLNGTAAMECHLTIPETNANETDGPAEGLLAPVLLSQKTGLSKQRLKECMHKGAVWLTSGRRTQRLRRAKKALKPGEELHLYYDPKVLDGEVPAAQLISDEGDYSVWFKPCGMLSQGSKWGDHASIARWAELQLTPQRSGFIVHRLDRATTGLILVAHSKKAARALSLMFEQRQLEKRYLAVVQGGYPEGTTDIDSDIDGRHACSHVSRREYDGKSDCSLVEVLIDTGRKHQIRRHLSESGFAIIGDRLYGDKDLADVDRKDLQLCAFSLTFTCPLSGQARQYVLPSSLWPSLD